MVSGGGANGWLVLLVLGILGIWALCDITHDFWGLSQSNEYIMDSTLRGHLYRLVVNMSGNNFELFSVVITKFIFFSLLFVSLPFIPSFYLPFHCNSGIEVAKAALLNSHSCDIGQRYSQIISEQRVASQASARLSWKNNLSAPIYSADGLWLRQPIYLLPREQDRDSPSERVG